MWTIVAHMSAYGQSLRSREQLLPLLSGDARTKAIAQAMRASGQNAAGIPEHQHIQVAAMQLAVRGKVVFEFTIVAAVLAVIFGLVAVVSLFSDFIKSYLHFGT